MAIILMLTNSFPFTLIFQIQNLSIELKCYMFIAKQLRYPALPGIV